MSKRKNTTRPAVKSPQDASLEEIVEFVERRQAMPITKASRKLYDFVNACVADHDFRHPQSEALLDLLLIVRDELCDNINEHWTLDDILAPITVQARRIATERQTAAMVETRKAESAAKAERDARILADVQALKASGTRSAAKIIARREGLSESRVNNICTAARSKGG